MAGELLNFISEEQHMKILRDTAIFSDTHSAKARAINELVQRYDARAIPVIMDVIDSLVSTDNALRIFCQTTLDRIRSHEYRK